MSLTMVDRRHADLAAALPIKMPKVISALIGEAQHLCSRFQLLAGRTRSLLDVGHNSCGIPRALIVSWCLGVPISEYLQDPAADP